jgi:4-aminobutyrate aminotransferase-like enzyme
MLRATGGSEAVDLALQAAMFHTGRRGLLSLEGSYHGNSLAGLSIGASDNRERIKNLLPHCGKIAPPFDAKAVRRIEQRLKRRDVAAFIMEPISINLGVLIPEKDAIRRVRDLCRRYGTLFIADEVASGFGRTGRLFACKHFDLDPDMLCVAKAMGGGLADRRGARKRADRDLDGGARRNLLLDLRLAPAQRRLIPHAGDF